LELRREVEALLRSDEKAGPEGTIKLGSPGDAVAGEMTASGQDVADPIPRRIAHFRILSRLGSGGAGTVFEALDERMNRRVALKVMSSALVQSGRAARRFEREAWIAGRLSHPHIVRVFERGTWEDYRYHSMELIGGGALQDVMETMRRDGRDERLGLSFGSAEYIHWVVRQTLLAARALHHAHQEGIVHRDVKPANLLLDGSPPDVKLVDFGIAIDEERTRLTTEGAVIGTIRYMAPEQLLGRTDEIDGSTDIHALGVTLFELLTLEYPYRGETHQRYVDAVLKGEARRPRQINGRVSRDLEVVIGKTLERERRHRYRSALEFAEDLDNVLHLRPIRARPPGPAERAAKWVHRKPLHAALIALLIAGVPTVGLLGYRAARQARELQATRVQKLESSVNLLAINGQTERMMTAAAELMEVDSTNVAALRTLAVGNARLARTASEPGLIESHRRDALISLDKLIASQPQVPGHLLLKADFLHQWGREAEAEEMKRRAAALPEPTDEDGLYYAGLNAILRGRREDLMKAEELLSRVIVRRPLPEALLWRGKVRQGLQHLDDAIADYQAAVAITPMDPVPHHQLGRIYTLQRRFPDARRELDRAVGLAPGDAIAHEVFAYYALEHGKRLRDQGEKAAALERFQEAEEHAARSLALDAALPLSQLNLGVSIVERARTTGTRDQEGLERALELFARARELAVETSDADAALADACDALIEYRQGPRAVSACQDVVTRLPGDAMAHYNLAGAYVLNGRPSEAMTELERDVKLGDTDHAALQADAWFTPLHDNPRFRALIRKMEQAPRSETGSK
jgi:tetratricopeptide (TPR) repeat protein